MGQFPLPLDDKHELCILGAIGGCFQIDFVGNWEMGLEGRA